MKAEKYILERTKPSVKEKEQESPELPDFGSDSPVRAEDAIVVLYLSNNAANRLVTDLCSHYRLFLSSSAIRLVVTHCIYSAFIY